MRRVLRRLQPRSSTLAGGTDTRRGAPPPLPPLLPLSPSGAGSSRLPVKWYSQLLGGSHVTVACVVLGR